MAWKHDIPAQIRYSNTVLFLVCSGVQPLNDIEEVNMFKDDNTVVHFRRPTGKLACSNYQTFE